MDLTIPVGNVTLNIRVAVLIKTNKGYILEKNKKGYHFVIGGRLKANETSKEAAKREVYEEIGVEIENLQLKAVLELFFKRDDSQIQEICFVYVAKIVIPLKLADNFGEYTFSEMQELDLRPVVIKEIIDSQNEEVIHLVHRQEDL